MILNYKEQKTAYLYNYSQRHADENLYFGTEKDVKFIFFNCLISVNCLNELVHLHESGIIHI